MLSLGFFNAYMLWALPLAAVPIIIHLLNRRRFNKIPWAAMEYLLRAMKRNRRRMQMEHWIVLLLRTLAVIFLVSLVTRPQLTGGGGILTGSSHHIVCLDNSASMRQRTGATNVYKAGVERIHKLVGNLVETNSGDLFTLILSSQRDKQPMIFASRVGPDLKKKVRDALVEPCGDSSLDAGDFLAAAKKWGVEKKKDAGDVHYYLITDSREHDFLTDGKPGTNVLKHLEEMDPAHQQMTLMLVGPKETDNLGITAVRRRDRLAMAKASVTLEIEVTNFGDDNSEATEVAVSIDDKSQVVRPVPSIPAGGRFVVDIDHTFHEPGFHAVVATTKKDRYPVDDTGVLAIEVMATSPVLVVDGDPGTNVEDGETFYLSAALDTGGDVVSGITVEAIQTTSLADYKLDHINMIFLANVSAPRPEVVKKLEEFVAAGGGLMMFLGNMTVERAMNDAMYKDGKGLLPLPLTTLKGNVDRPDPAFVSDTTHFAIKSNAELLDLILSKMVLIQRYYEMAEGPDDAVSIPIRVKGATGSPLLVSKTFKQGGYSLVFGSSADLKWNDMCQSPAFLVLLMEIHKHATRVHSLAPYNLSTDGTLSIDLDPAEYRRDVLIRGIGAQGFEGTYSSEDKKESDTGKVESALMVPMSELTGLGVFKVTLTPHRGDAEVRLLTRSAPSAEGRMQRLNKEGWDRNFAFPDRLEVKDGTTGGQGSEAGEGEIWRLLALILLTVLLLETLLAWRFGRR
jgi:uncharacterized membrane protein